MRFWVLLLSTLNSQKEQDKRPFAFVPKKKWFRVEFRNRDSNPGRLGESQVS